ncbi:MAG: YdcF family protein [Anaerolineales bacterium]|nr:YdcF family protein [Anaerolineales bacterium]MCX7755351.1 YdcF family protein [Anaerolineales bacterium]MDW8279120.1 ElyC/SanA/YdcF family protein [Anaerolineales bacterium]
MLKRLFRAFTRLVFGLVIAGMAVLLLPRLFVGLFGWAYTYTENEAPTRPVAIVFGAGLTRSGEATPVLRDRIQTAARLYFAGKVRKLLMTGDNSTVYYNEPEAMRRYALALGVPDEDIVLDYAGRRTYDSCYRAREIFGVQSAILVTQKFHLPRALYLCNMLGIDGVGVAAENFRYRRMSLLFWNLRELAATLTALIDVHLTRPLPILGQPEPIFPYQAQ